MINPDLKEYLTEFIANELEDSDDESDNLRMLDQVILFVWDNAEKYKLSFDEISYRFMFDKLYDDSFDMVIDQICYTVMAIKENIVPENDNMSQHIMDVLKQAGKIQ